MYKHFNINTKFRIAKESSGHDRFTEKQILYALYHDEAFIDNGFIIRKIDKKVMAAPPNYQPTMSQELHERMNGLASIKGLTSLTNLIHEWIDEGFDKDDINTFINQHTQEIINQYSK